MPLTEKGTEIKKAMESEYGPEKGERVFYASRNAGKISGVDEMTANDVPIADCYKDAAQDSEAPAYNSVPLIDPTAIGGLGPYSGSDAPSQPSGMSEPADVAPPAPHAGCDPAMSFDWIGTHDYSNDVHSRMSGLPETISQKQMVGFAAAMNYGEGVTK
jgi:hypothetical protein